MPVCADTFWFCHGVVCKNRMKVQCFRKVKNKFTSPSPPPPPPQAPHHHPPPSNQFLVARLRLLLVLILFRPSRRPSTPNHHHRSNNRAHRPLHAKKHVFMVFASCLMVSSLFFSPFFSGVCLKCRSFVCILCCFASCSTALMPSLLFGVCFRARWLRHTKPKGRAAEEGKKTEKQNKRLTKR